MRLLEGALYVVMGAVPAAAVVASLAGTSVIPVAPVPTGLADETPGAAEGDEALAASDCPEVRDRLQRLQAQAHLLDEQLRGLRAEEYDLVGAPAEWPDDLEPGTGPDAAETVAMRLGEEGLIVHEVDCSEPPCMVTVFEPFGTDLDVGSLSERVGHQVGSPYMFATEEGIGRVMVVAPQTWSHVHQDRRFWRRKIAAQALEAALEAGEIALPKGGDASAE